MRRAGENRDMHKLLSPLARRGWLVAALGVLTVGIFVLMQVLFASRMAALPDGFLYYTSGTLISSLDALGPSGRLLYLYLHILDMVLPLAYGLFMALVVVRLWGMRGGAVKTASVLSVLPLVAAFFDYAENVCIRVVSALFSGGRTSADIVALNPLAASLAGFATAGKWTFCAISVLAILAGVVFWITRRVKRRA